MSARYLIAKLRQFYHRSPGLSRSGSPLSRQNRRICDVRGRISSSLSISSVHDNSIARWRIRFARTMSYVRWDTDELIPPSPALSVIFVSLT